MKLRLEEAIIGLKFVLTKDDSGLTYISKPVQLCVKTVKSGSSKIVVSIGLSFSNGCINADMAVS